MLSKKILLVLSFLLLCNCNKTNSAIGIDKIQKLPKFEKTSEGNFIIRYSNIILEKQGKIVKVPIYGGIYDDITFEDFYKQNPDIKEYILSPFILPKNGEVKKTFLDILKFYKKSLFKDIDVNKPSVIGGEGNSLFIIWYDFIYEGFPSSMMILVNCDEEATIKKMQVMNKGKKSSEYQETIDMLVFQEDSNWIELTISIGKSSRFKK